MENHSVAEASGNHRPCDETQRTVTSTPVATANISCMCMRSACDTRRCGCKKNGLQCGDNCACIAARCKNRVHDQQDGTTEPLLAGEKRTCEEGPEGDVKKRKSEEPNGTAEHQLQRMVTAEELYELIMCAVCLETCSSPRQLPCQHVFCLECIQGLVPPGGANIACPLCRENVKLPPGGSEEFPISFFMNSLCETVHMFVACQGGICGFCKEDGEESPGTWLCLKCCLTMCLPCKKHHTRALGHDIIECSTINKDSLEEIIKTRNEKCPTHQNEDLQFFCETCKMFLCMSCFVNEHFNCSTKVISVMLDVFQQQLTTWKVKLEHMDTQCKQFTVNVQNITQCFDSAVNKVQRKANEYKKIVEEWESEQISQLRQQQKSTEEKPDLQIAVTKTQEQVTKHLKNINAIASCSTSVDFAHRVMAEEGRFNAATTVPLNIRTTQRTVDANLPFVDKVKSSLGRAILVTACKESEFEIPFDVDGMALMHNGNLVISGWECNWVAIYTQSGQLVRDISLPLGSVVCDVACSQNQIFVVDRVGQIHMFSYDGNTRRVMERCLPTGDSGLAFHDGNLYICTMRTNQIRKYDLNMAYGKRWSYVDMSGANINGPAKITIMHNTLIISNNNENNIVGFNHRRREKVFSIPTAQPSSFDFDAAGYIMFPQMVNNKPQITIHNKLGDYVGCIGNVIPGVKRPDGIVLAGHGRLFCGCEPALNVFKVVRCSYQII